MDVKMQGELNNLISKVRRFAPEVSRRIKTDLNEAAKILVSEVKANAPISKAPHRTKTGVVRPGNLRKSIRRIGLRRAKAVAVVGPGYGGANDGYYARFVEQGTKYQRAQRFIDRARQSAGPKAQDLAVSLILKRVSDYEKKHFK